MAQRRIYRNNRMHVDKKCKTETPNGHEQRSVIPSFFNPKDIFYREGGLR